MTSNTWRPFERLEKAIGIDLHDTPPMSFDIKPILEQAKRDLSAFRSRSRIYQTNPPAQAIGQFNPADIPSQVVDEAEAAVQRKETELSVISDAYTAARRREQSLEVRRQFERRLYAAVKHLARSMYRSQPKEKKEFTLGESPQPGFPRHRVLASSPQEIRLENGSYQILIFMENLKFDVSVASQAAGVDIASKWTWVKSSQTIIYVDWNSSMITPNAPEEELSGVWGVIDKVGSVLAEEIITSILLAGVGKVTLLTARGVRRVYQGVKSTRALNLSRRAWTHMDTYWRKIIGRFANKAPAKVRTATAPTNGVSRATNSARQAGGVSRRSGGNVAEDAFVHAGGRGGVQAVKQAIKKTADDFVHEVQEEAAKKALEDQVFVEHLKRGTRGLTNAGSRFHKIAANTAEGLASRLPAGLEVIAEKPFRTAAGNIKKPDLLILNRRTMSIYQYDWKKNILSEAKEGARAVEKANQTAGAAQLGLPGFTVTANESRSWLPAVNRALARHPDREQLLPVLANALGTHELSVRAIQKIERMVESEIWKLLSP